MKYRAFSLVVVLMMWVSPALSAALPMTSAALGWTLFGSKEIPSTNMKAFGKWTEMWRRHNLTRVDGEVKDIPQEEHKCRGRYRARCSREAWEVFIAETKVDDPLETLKAVNLYMNRSPYIVDPVNWGIPDYWATPDEFFWKDGDCEDYAISKYVTLKRLGFDPETMRIVILQDENLRAAHAVLAVEQSGEIYILDNQVDAVLPHEQILHYRPVYSLNEGHWWLHRVNKFSR